MKITLSCAMSLDGFLDDRTPERLILSNAADFDAVDELRARADAIFVGAGTLRADNPRLLVRDPARIAARRARGQSPQPCKVTWTASGNLDAGANVFTCGVAQKIVYASSVSTQVLAARLRAVAEVVTAETLEDVLSDLAARGIGHLLVEGGARLSSLVIDRADTLRLAIAPVLIGREGGARFAEVLGSRARLKLSSVVTFDEIVVLTYGR